MADGGRVEHLVGRMVVSNNARIHRLDAGRPNPRPLAGQQWHDRLAAAAPRIRSEWDAFVAAGGRIPLIEEVVDEHQGNDGPWRAGLLVRRDVPIRPLADAFPETVAALRDVPNLRAALWSVLEPGTELPEHVGPNAGILRYHLGVRCPEGAALRVGETVTPYREGDGIWFDDTEPHAAWNRGTADRVTLFCEIERPLPGVAARANRMVQAMIALDPRYRHAPVRAARLHRRLNFGQGPAARN